MVKLERKGPGDGVRQWAASSVVLDRIPLLGEPLSRLQPSASIDRCARKCPDCADHMNGPADELMRINMMQGTRLAEHHMTCMGNRSDANHKYVGEKEADHLH